jgi:hypothetical protein
MVRMQIQLTESQATAIRRLASATGKSAAELVRQGVDLYLISQKRPTPEEQLRRALSAVGRFRSGLRDVSTEHDRYLAEAFKK